METNFRITTSYIFELYNDTTQNYHMVWLMGQDGKVTFAASRTADTQGVALDFEIDRFPQGTNDSNYRLNQDNRFQLYNTTTAKWHSIWVSSATGKPALKIEQIGEE